MGSIPFCYRRKGGTYALRRTVRFQNSKPQPISLSLRTKTPSVARKRAAAACAALDRVVIMINQSIALKGSTRPASELADLARRALDAHLGFALQDQLTGPDPDAEAASIVFGDFFALAARQGGTVDLDDAEQARLTAEGRSEQHMRNLHNLIQHNRGSQPLSDRHLELRLAELGYAFDPARAANDRRVMLTAWANAQYLSTRFNSADVQAQPSPIDYLLNNPKQVPPTMAHGASVKKAVNNDIASHAPAHPAYPKPSSDGSVPLLSEVVDEIVASIVLAGKWNDGAGSTAEDARRLLRQFVWIVGDFPVDQYSQRHVAKFFEAMMMMPKTVRVQAIWHIPYAQAARAFPKLTAANTRHARTMNKDLAYLSTAAERMVSVGHWREGVIRPLALSVKVSVKHKAKAKAPWTNDNITQMFNSPIYTGNDGPKRRQKPGSQLYHDAAYWVLAIAAHTGGCLNEICGMLLDEIVADGVTMPHLIFQENALRGLKREARERWIPIHPRLIDLGLLDYVGALRREGAVALFPELWIYDGKRGGDQYRAIVWNKLIDWLRRQEVKIPLGITGKESDFHSVRSTVLSLLDRADINQNIVADIAGHARTGVAATTYQDLIATGGLQDALQERLAVLLRLPDFTAGIAPCAVKLLPINLRSR